MDTTSLETTILDGLAAAFAAGTVKPPGQGDYYEGRLKPGLLFLNDDRLLAARIAATVPPGMTVLEVGAGYGELAFLLAQSGIETLALEPAVVRLTAAQAVLAHLRTVAPEVAARVTLRDALFPSLPDAASLPLPMPGAAVMTNVTGAALKAAGDSPIDALSRFQHLFLNLARFGRVRDQAEQSELLAAFERRGFLLVETIRGHVDAHLVHLARPGARARPPAHGGLLRDLLVFHRRELQGAELFPRLQEPAAGVAIFPPAFQARPFNAASAPLPQFGEDGVVRFAAWGEHALHSSFGTFRCLLLDPSLGTEAQIIELARFVSANSVHSWCDLHLVQPEPVAPTPFVTSAILRKLFRSDQPIGLHCTMMSELLIGLGALLGLTGRRVDFPRSPLDDGGHVAAEFWCPERQSWMLVDIDYACFVADAEGRPLSAAAALRARQAGRPLQIRPLIDRRWLEESWNFSPWYDGQFTWKREMIDDGSLEVADVYPKLLNQSADDVTYWSVDIAGADIGPMQETACPGLPWRAERVATWLAGGGMDAGALSAATDQAALIWRSPDRRPIRLANCRNEALPALVAALGLQAEWVPAEPGIAPIIHRGLATLARAVPEIRDWPQQADTSLPAPRELVAP